MDCMYSRIAMDVIRDDWAMRKLNGGQTCSQEKLTRAMGISRSQFARAISKNSKKDPSISFLCAYCYAVGRPPASLLSEIGERVQSEKNKRRNGRKKAKMAVSRKDNPG